MPRLPRPDTLNLLRLKASRSAISGAIIAMVAVVSATVLAAWSADGGLSPGSLIDAQKSNVVLWLMDLMPFGFAFWGQYVGSIVAEEANTLVSNHKQVFMAEAELLQKQISHSENFDALTSLPNRIMLKQLLAKAIDVARVDNGMFALIILGVNGFRKINDTLGHNRGDFLLKQIARRLEQAVPSTTALPARLGGDEFALLIPAIAEKSDIICVIEDVCAIFSTTYVVGGLPLMVEAGLGAAVYPDDGRDIQQLIRNADIAMNECKSSQAGFKLYAPELDHHNVAQLMFKAEMQAAIEGDELCLYFQPKIDSDNRVAEVEVLVRWLHPEKGLIQPDSFVPQVEKNGLNSEMFHWVLHHAMLQAAEWKKMDLDIRIAVNLSALDLLDMEIPEVIGGMLQETGLSPDDLKLEITETTIMADQEKALQVLTAITRMGLQISIDDFGTGYSSFDYLSRLPVCELKIDRSFVSDMLENSHNAVIVRAMIDLAHNLSMQVVAEGVQDEMTMQRLKELGCDYLQGYHISKPVDAIAFLNWREHWYRQRFGVADIPA